jgi:RimJ/RimL family protein N-acetyltransferase
VDPRAIPPPPELRCERALVRELRPDDAAAFAEGSGDPAVVRFSGQTRRLTVDSAREMIARTPEWREAGDALELAVADPATAEFWGSIGLWKLVWADERAELGFWLLPRARERGAASAAVRLLSRWAFAELGLARLDALSDHDNPASHRVLTAAGFREEGRMRSFALRDDGRADTLLFGLLPGELRP